ncbi:MAG: glutamate--tRNA ligase [candidate division Zixibacteria bacterium HGW-Zixibacteria-1]|nr:MAG: glutamate--tRNA ligase [candidate division Zixibacteria bacterium HGW-Zixibacteria-1]
MTSETIRVRIAPSPTGYLHVGTARTAIFNWLFARNSGGKFIVRIEDTDIERSQADLVEPILDALKWLGLDWDEEPYFQSQRMDRYNPYVERLLQSAHAYRCFCTPEELERRRNAAMAAKESPSYNKKCRNLSEHEITDNLNKGMPFAVRLAIPDGETSYDDLVSGTITRQNSEIEDFVVLRNDGRAVYNMAVVVDDHEMAITHVIRGNDHISNTFKQVHIYRGLGLDIPKFAHVPLILRPDKKKVSKRLGDKDVAEYGKDGILPEALFNFLCLLGWSPKDDREFLPREELIRIFTLDNVNRANPIFNEEKLLSLNAEYIRSMSDHDLAVIAGPLLVEAGHTTKYWLETRWDYLRKVVGLLKERCRRTTDFVRLSGYFFFSDFQYDPDAAKKTFTPESKEYLIKLLEKFGSIDKFTKESLEAALNNVAGQIDVKKGKLIHPTRLAVSGISEGPGLYDILEAIGKEETVKRIKRAIEFIDNQEG